MIIKHFPISPPRIHRETIFLPGFFLFFISTVVIAEIDIKKCNDQKTTLEYEFCLAEEFKKINKNLIAGVS